MVMTFHQSIFQKMKVKSSKKTMDAVESKGEILLESHIAGIGESTVSETNKIPEEILSTLPVKYEEGQQGEGNIPASAKASKDDISTVAVIETSAKVIGEEGSPRAVQKYEPGEELQKLLDVMPEETKAESSRENAQVITCTKEERAIQNIKESKEEDTNAISDTKEKDTGSEESDTESLGGIQDDENGNATSTAEETSELKVSDVELYFNEEIQKENSNEVHEEERSSLIGVPKVEPREDGERERYDDSPFGNQKTTQLKGTTMEASNLDIEISEKASDCAPEEGFSRSQDAMINREHLNNEANETNETIKNEVSNEQKHLEIEAEKLEAKYLRPISVSGENISHRELENELIAEKYEGEKSETFNTARNENRDNEESPKETTQLVAKHLTEDKELQTEENLFLETFIIGMFSCMHMPNSTQDGGARGDVQGGRRGGKWRKRGMEANDPWGTAAKTFLS
ncbi:unnamed protein product [Prunus armeniaca]|uniref:Uncharacterized protein n=2 Tax=Prunus armeniaca TaxID=36596 RepID=A0A6J5UG32_PRUAR|nr:unnamed protein product [Prunus armeniaca]